MAGVKTVNIPIDDNIGPGVWEEPEVMEVEHTTLPPANARGFLTGDRLMTPEDVAKFLGFGIQTARAIIEESGYRIKLHRRVFIRESKLVEYLASIEGIELAKEAS